MKKNVIIGMALALGMLSVGAMTASAAETCGKCADSQAVQQFRQETDSLVTVLKTKKIELAEQNAYRISESGAFDNGPDVGKINALEAEIKVLSDKVNASATKFKIPPCSRS